MNFIFAKEKISAGTPMRRKAWESECRVIRAAIESDHDFINYHPLTGLLVDDCKERKCDCEIVIFRPTEEDTKAEDWVEA